MQKVYDSIILLLIYYLHFTGQKFFCKQLRATTQIENMFLDFISNFNYVVRSEM